VISRLLTGVPVTRPRPRQARRPRPDHRGPDDE